MKISREGVLLIKSFEGFRPRAVQNSDGRWVVGYGHTASAREGASVSEADAELLLQYDLIPVQASLTQGLKRPVNQHQYDALASFAFSVGTDAFGSSDVLTQVNAGAETQAADAMIAWPEPPVRDAGLRRRAAERALFNADPSAPVTLSDLLAAPLLTPPEPRLDVAGDIAETEAAPPEPEMAIEPEVSPQAEDAPSPIETPIFAPEINEPVFPEPGVAEPDLPEVASDDTPLIDPVAQDAGVDADIVTDTGRIELADFSPPAVDPETANNDARNTPYGGPRTGPLPLVMPEVAPGDDPFAHVNTAADPFTGAVVAPPSPIVWPGLTDEATVTGELITTGTVAESAALASPRLVWPRDDSEMDAEAPSLFEGENDLNESQNRAIWPEPFDAKSIGFSWRRVWAYLLMGGFGLVCLAMSMAALRKASLATSEVQSIVIIASVLAIIGAACVGVSAYNIYQRLSDDR